MDDALLTAALAEMARKGWTGLRPDGLAASGLPLGRLYDAVPDPLAVLRELVARADRAMLSDIDPAGTPRDRLFEAAMARFDALAPAKAALRRIARSPESLIAAPFMVPLHLRSAQWMLAAAGLPATKRRLLRLGTSYPRAFRAWLGDDSTDQGPTMKAVDRMVGRVEGKTEARETPASG